MYCKINNNKKKQCLNSGFVKFFKTFSKSSTYLLSVCYSWKTYMKLWRTFKKSSFESSSKNREFLQSCFIDRKLQDLLGMKDRKP